ncbi:MAG TPA: hypothetical protein VK501_00465 [Baekduia sp.]|uniref:hypothetical protein n=1 Tax=Baekduia sp. TaxID=2600305 RepID=UPI002CAE1B81|nr:hypothetical protein [Baekduia sp.]HMJ32358.1 hypothetical protein [Baekduia sp.]
MRPRTRLATTIAVAFGSAALAGPAIAATGGQDMRSPDAVEAAAPPRPAFQQDLRSPDASDVPAQVVQDLRSPDAADSATADGVAPAVATQSASGFDWSSAAIGAGGALGLVAIALGSALALHRRHETLPHSPIAH